MICSSLNIAMYRDKEEDILNFMKERKIYVMGLAVTRIARRERCRGYVLMYSLALGRGCRQRVGMIIGS